MLMQPMEDRQRQRQGNAQVFNVLRYGREDRTERQIRHGNAQGFDLPAAHRHR